MYFETLLAQTGEVCERLPVKRYVSDMKTDSQKIILPIYTSTESK